MTVEQTALLPIIVEMKPAVAPFGPEPNLARAQQALQLLVLHGLPVGELPIVGGAAGWATPTAIQLLSQQPNVAFIHEDRTVGPRPNSAPAPSWPPGSLKSLYPQEVKADQVWSQSQGAGVGVAVLDSGVNPDPDLAGRIVKSISFAGTYLEADPGGHGTHVAGIIAGNGTRSAGEYRGIAPAANIISVRVLDRNGNGRLSSVIAGLQWVISHRAQYNIRVINLSLGAPALPSHRADPLAAAVEMAWKRGIVVVVASGNDGPNGGSVQSPGIDPWVITAGATDDLGTLSLADDTLAWFSSWGTQIAAPPKPDLVAPGRKLVSIRVPNSVLDNLLASHRVTAGNGSSHFRLTGSSQSTAVVSGTVALVLARTPSLKPNEVKKILVSKVQGYGPGGTPVGLPAPTADGSGLLNTKAAFLSGPLGQANGGQYHADAFARSIYPLIYGQPLSWRDPNYQGIAWNTLTWATLAWTNIAWDNIAWDNIAWDNIAWDNIGWDNIAWDNIAWD